MKKISNSKYHKKNKIFEPETRDLGQACRAQIIWVKFARTQILLTNYKSGCIYLFTYLIIIYVIFWNPPVTRKKEYWNEW